MSDCKQCAILRQIIATLQSMNAELMMQMQRSGQVGTVPTYDQELPHAHSGERGA